MNKRKKISRKKLLKHKIFRMRNIFSIVILVLTITLLITLCVLNIIPLKQILLTTLIFLVLNIISIIFINVHEKIYLKVIGYVMIAITILSNGIFLYYASNTKNFLKESFKETYNKSTYYVISNTEDSINDETVYNIGTFKDGVNLETALEKLNNKYKVNEIRYDDMEVLINDLNIGNLNLVLLDKSSYEIYFKAKEELDKKDYNILYEYDSYEENKTVDEIKKDIINIYVSGKDETGIADFNMIATINTKTHKVLLTAIPREYYIEVATKDGRYDTLNSISTYGSSIDKKSLEKLLNINIDYNIVIDTNNLVSIIDYIGGIEYESDIEFTASNNGKCITVKKGKQKINGTEALIIAKEIKAFDNNEVKRHENCIKLTEAIINKIMKKKTLFHYNETLNTIGKLYNTNIPRNVAEKLIKETLDNDWDIEIQSVEGTEGYDSIHLSSIYGEVIYPNYDTIEIAKQKINKIMK